MTQPWQLSSERCLLRPWLPQDAAPFAALNADPQVMRFFPEPLTSQQSDALMQRASDKITANGWGFWALALKPSGQFIGMLGLNPIDVDSGIPQAPFVEIGWRLSRAHWGNGYAVEAAQAALQFAFSELQLPAVYAFTALANLPSQRVMQKLGMHNCQQDFDHPKLPAGHPLQRHCLYRIQPEQFNH